MARGDIPTGRRTVGVRGPRGGGNVASPVAGVVGGPRVASVDYQPQFGRRALAEALTALQVPLGHIVDQEMRQQAKKAERESSDAGARWGVTANIADLNLPTGDSIGEEAFRRSAIQAASANVELFTRGEIDKLAQQFPGKPEEFKKALQERQQAILGGVDPNLAAGAANAIASLGQRYYVQLDEDRRAYIKDQARSALVELSETKTNAAAIAARRGDYDGAMHELAGLGETMASAGPVEAGGSGAFSLEKLAEFQMEAQNKVRSNMLEGWAERAPNKRAALAGLRSGKTGDAVVDGVLAISDPQLSDQMAARLETDIRAEEVAANAAAARAKAERAARRSIASDVVRDTVFALQNGKLPDSLADAKKAAAEFPDLASKISVAETQREGAAEFLLLPPRQREDILNQFAADPTMDRTQIEFVQALGKRHNELAGNKNQYSAAVDAGLVPPTPLDISDPTSVAARVASADTIEQAWGPKTSGWRDDEVTDLKDKLDGLPPEQQATTLGALSTLMGDRFQYLLSQIADKAPGVALAAKVAGKQPQLAADVLRGRQMLKDGTVQKASDDDYTDDAKSKLQTALMHSPTGYAAVLDAATALDAARRFDGGNPDKASYQSANFQAAIDDLTGGVIEYNGQPIIAPERGVDEGDFENVIGAVDDADLAVTTEEGRPLLPVMSTGATLTAESFRKYGTLESVGDGQYLVRIANGYALDPRTGQSFVFDWSTMTNDARQRVAAEKRGARERLMPGGDDLAGDAGLDRLAPGVGGKLEIPLNPSLTLLLQRLLGRVGAPTYNPQLDPEELGIPPKAAKPS